MESTGLESTAIEEVPELPTLDSGVTLLAADGRGTGALQSLVLDRVLLDGGEAVWVDAKGHAATTSLARVAPSRRTLDRIRVARAFTAFQHYSLVEDLPGTLSEETSLVVAPSVEWFYANDDLLAGEGREMLAGTLETLGSIAADRDLPVLVTKSAGDGLGGHVEASCDARLECTMTRFGARFSAGGSGGDDGNGESGGFETLVYDCAGGAVQTTLAFWRRVLERRHAVGGAADAPQEGSADAPREVVARGPH